MKVEILLGNATKLGILVALNFFKTDYWQRRVIFPSFFFFEVGEGDVTSMEILVWW